MKLIPLTQGKFVKVDDDDYDFLNQWKWFYGTVGYAVRSVVVDGKNARIYMHRIISKTGKGMVTDHINKDKLDNRKINLRNVSSSINNINREISTLNTSGYSGIHWYKSRNKWQAYISYKKKRKNLGYFDDLKEAIKARKYAENLIIKGEQ